MKTILVFVLLIAGVVIYLKRSSSKREADEEASRDSQAPAVESSFNPYRAVSIVSDPTGPGACEAVKAVGGTRFLLAEAPELPLPDCDLPCACKFAHYRDRRDNHEDRRRPRSLAADIYDRPERRGKTGRRATDAA